MSAHGVLHDVDGHAMAVDFVTDGDTVGSYRTAWGRGVFDDSLRSFLPPLVWNHNENEVIGRAKSWENLGNRTRIVSRFANFDAVPRARAVHSMIADGIVPGHSFHFRQGVAKPHHSVRSARTFVKARLMETSPVTFPATGASVAGIRSRAAVVSEFDFEAELGRLFAKGIRGWGTEDECWDAIDEHNRIRRDARAMPERIDRSINRRRNRPVLDQMARLPRRR